MVPISYAVQSTSAVYHLTSPNFRKSLVPLHHNHRVIYLRGVSLRVGDLTLAQFGDKHRKLALEPSERSELVFRCNEVRAARGSCAP